jgi:hypothetical protein
MSSCSTPLRILALFLLALTVLNTAHADSDVYDFEIVVFERPGDDDGEAMPASPGEPDPAAAVGRLDALAIGGRSLGPVAYTLRQKGMIVHEHLAWRQVPRGRDSEAWYWIGGGRMAGLIRVTRGRYLHLETDLLLRDANSSRPYRVRLYRRMRSGELHYVDHPKLGILIKAERHEPSAAQDAIDAAPGEPRPVRPGVAPG